MTLLVNLMANLCDLSPSEYEKIAEVLKRDRELRAIEEARIRQLKQELNCLRKRAALKPGVNPQRHCSRCLTELGRILNRGAICPQCYNKVCKNCREYGDETFQWHCIYCYKQMQLKAISGEWMTEFGRLSLRQPNASVDQLPKVLHSSQYQGLTESEDKDSSSSQVSIETPPEKPPRLLMNSRTPLRSVSSDQDTKLNEPNCFSSEEMPLDRQKSYPLESSPKVLPRINPWTDIEPEPTIPVRINKSRPAGALQQTEYPEPVCLKERQSSDEGRCTLRSRSTSSDVMDESESYVPVPIPRKRINPLKKQQAIPDQNPVDNQQSSIETTDSGVFSPGIKTEFSIDTNPPSSPFVSRLSSNDRESVDSHSLIQCLVSESSLSETDDDYWPQHRNSGNVYKKRKAAYSRSAEERRTAHSADSQPPMPLSGLNHSSFHHNNGSFSPCTTNFKQKLIRSHVKVFDHFRYCPDSFACRKPNNPILTDYNSNSKICALCCNPEALCSGCASCKGTKQPTTYDVRWKDQNMLKMPKSNRKRKELPKNCMSRCPLIRKKRSTKRCRFQYGAKLDSSKCISALKRYEVKNCSKDTVYCLGVSDELHQVKSLTKSTYKVGPRSTLIRSASLPSFKTFSGEGLNTCLWQCHSLEDWQWCSEEPCQSRDLSRIPTMLPDDYKLVYVSPMSSSSSSDECLTSCDELPYCFTNPLESKSDEELKLNSFSDIISGSSIGDSDWELTSDDNEECEQFNLFSIDVINRLNHDISKKSHRSQSQIESLSLTNDYRGKIQLYSSKSPLNDINFIPMKHRSLYLNSVLNTNYHFSFNVERYTSPFFCEDVKGKKGLEQVMILNRNAFNFQTFSCLEPPPNFCNNLQKQFVCNLNEINKFHLSFYYYASMIQGFTGNSLIIYYPSKSYHHTDVLFNVMPKSHHICCEWDDIPNNSSYKFPLLTTSKSILPQRNLCNMDDVYLMLAGTKCTDSQMLLKHKEDNLPVSESIFSLKNVNINYATAFLLIMQECVPKKITTSFHTKSAVYHVNLHLRPHIPYVCLYSSRDSFRNNFTSTSAATSWRDCSERKVGQQLDDANAFLSSAFPLSSYAANRSNDNSTTGWGKIRCCIAVATQRVIDLNLRALVCVREVLDSADLTSYLDCKAGSEVKLFSGAVSVNAFSYRNPPVFLKPEADYFLFSTRLERFVLFQRFFHEKRDTRMIAVKLEGTGVSSFDKTDHENTSNSSETKQFIGMQSKEAGNFAQNEIFLPFSVDSYWVSEENDESFKHSSLSSDSDCSENVNKHRFTSLDSLTRGNVGVSDKSEEAQSSILIDKTCVKCDLYTHVPKTNEKKNDFELLDTEILPFVKNIFCSEFENEYLKDEKEISFMSVSDIIDISERVDCQCNKPCEVPSSPSVVDATVERSIADDGEVLSSGDELDKFESDTDSQDTVIEGEAYKRIRSVAIKEKILHANEELFGSSSKEMLFNHDCSNLSSNGVNTRVNQKVQMCSVDEAKNKLSLELSPQNVFAGNIPDLPLYSDSEESDALTIFSSLGKHFQSFRKHPLSAFQPVPSHSNNISGESKDIPNRTDMHSLSSYSFSESVCSSESSDNGSDGEELILSDTSTSSDEATYVAPSAGFQYYSPSMSYKLHTIAEESCEETERCLRNPVSIKAHSESEYFDKTRLSLSSSKKANSQLFPDNHILSSNSEYKIGKSSAVYAVMATSRLEKYFKSGLNKGNKISYPDDDMTDESGEVSSDDDVASNKLRNSLIGKRCEKQYKSQKMAFSADNSICQRKYKRFENSSLLKSSSSDAKINRSSESKIDCDQSNLSPKTEHGVIDVNQSKVIEQVSDEEAKYIMNHLMQHITNNGEGKSESSSEIKNMSPMLKILESEIARLMLTVSPASLSAGEPSSSCSSTIGSNNSDYGSDTLESAEESTSEEEVNAEMALENQPMIDMPSHRDSVSPQIETVSASNPDFTLTPDPVVSEETLYICKQLMASLKKITVSTDGSGPSDEICTANDDHSAKQYITDQIVSLMQTVNASHNNSPLLQRLSFNLSPTLQMDSDVSRDHSDLDSPPPNDEKREHSKSKTPSESGSETTISASISIPSYDDSDRTPTESEISHEMDELYALLESSNTSQDMIASAKFSYDVDNHSFDKNVPSRNANSPLSEEDIYFPFSESLSCDANSDSPEPESSLLCGAASQLESLLPISIEERIARYKDAFLNKVLDPKEQEFKTTETRINVILPQPSTSDLNCYDVPMSASLPLYFDSVLNSKVEEKLSAMKSCDNILSSCSANKSKSEESSYNVTSVKIISHNTYPPSSAIHKILSNNIDSTYIDKKHDYKVVSICDSSADENPAAKEISNNFVTDSNSDNRHIEDNPPDVLSPMLKVMNPKEKASSENDLLVANYRTKCKSNKVFGTKSVGNICELENISNKSAFRDTGYYSFKSSEESFLSLDDSTASQTSTASLTQYRSLTSTETIPEEEESSAKGATPTKMSLSSSNIPDAVCGSSASKSSTLPLSLRNKLSSSNTNHRTRSSFFSTSGVLRKLTLLRDESGNSLRSSPHGRLRMRNRSLSGGSDDGRQRKTSVPQISVSECLENQPGRLSSTNSDKDITGIHDEDIDQPVAYNWRSNMSLSSFGGRSESVTSVYSAAGGGRYGTVIVTGDVFFSLSYNHKIGALEINIKECRNLAPVDTKRNRSDPYVKVYLLPDRTKSGKRKTKVKKHTLNPVFDELLKFHVTVSELEIRTLWLSVWHSDRFGRNDFLGEVMLPLGNDNFESSGLKWYPLQERLETLDAPVSYKGDLILSLKYVPPDVTSRKISKKPCVPVKGALEVLVREARNLMATRSNGTSDPFCKSYLLPDKSKGGKQKTSVFKKSCNPKWIHTFVYDDVSLDDLRERCLELTIWDYDKITSNDFLGGVRLCLGTGKYQGRDVDWMDSVGEERSLWYTMLERPNTWVDGSLLLRPSMQSRRAI